MSPRRPCFSCPHRVSRPVATTRRQSPMTPRRRRLPRLGWWFVCGLFATLCLNGRSWAQAPTPDALQYEVEYDVRILPTERAAHVRIRLGKHAARVQRLKFRIDPARHFDFQGKGDVKVTPSHVEWYPPAGGGKLEYLFRIDQLRDARRYDARSAENWALFRGDDLIPPVHASTDDGARAVARLTLRLPDGWSAAVPFPKSDDGSYRVDQEHRGFDRPTGWVLVGNLSALRVKLEGMHLTIASPKKSEMRRQDLLALLRWTLPVARDLVGTLPERLLIVGAGDPMWRGGLSGPSSFYLHTGRPLIENDMTSPPLHELVHTLLHAKAAADSDWIIEGLAEYYSLQLLLRSRTISKRGYAKALKRLAEKGKRATALRVAHADGIITARAVIILHALDDEIRRRTENRRTLDDVFRLVAQKRDRITTAAFQELAETVAAADLSEFFSRYVPALEGEVPPAP